MLTEIQPLHQEIQRKMFLSSGALQDGRSMCEWELFHIGGALIQGPSKLLNTWLAVAK